METYSEFAPTGFDSAGAFLPDRQDWLVVPVGQTRDSGCLSQSNFDSAVQTLGGESETVEVHRFGHWGPGWFEIIIVKPDTPQADTATEIEGALSDYPVLDEEDFSRRETEETEAYWDNMSTSERVEYLQENGETVFAARSDGTNLYERAPDTFYHVQACLQS